METIAVSKIASGADLFFCEPYKCKLLARACVERQAKVAIGNVESLRQCKGCGLGLEVKSRAAGVVVDLEALTKSVKRAAPNRAAHLRAPKFNPALKATSPAPPAVARPIEPLPPAQYVELPAIELYDTPRALPEPTRTAAASVVPKKTTPASRPLSSPAPGDPGHCEHGTSYQDPCERCEKEPLTRAKLDRALIVYGQYWGAGERGPSDAILDEWTQFYHAHGGELIALALAALGRIEPRRAGITHEKHKLGAAQQRIVDLLSDNNPRTVSEVAAALGKNYQNTRRMLPVLQARGMIRNEHTGRSGQGGPSVWLAVGAPAVGKTIHPQRCEMNAVSDEQCGRHATCWVTFGDAKPQASCDDCVEIMRATGALEMFDGAKVVPIEDESHKTS